MDRKLHSDETSLFEQDNYVNWNEYYPRLLSLAKYFVYMYRIPCWYGQEKDIMEDVVQETMLRMIKRIHKSAQGEVIPINSMEGMMTIIARNYVLDLRRHDRRLVHVSETSVTDVETHTGELENTSETAIQQIFHEWVFLQIVHHINQLPRKQRCAILIDLANRMSFDSRPTPLQAAFLTVGIDLQEYRQQLPENSVERARHSALLSLAYKRIAQYSIKNDLFSVA